MTGTPGGRAVSQVLENRADTGTAGASPRRWHVLRWRPSAHGSRNRAQLLRGSRGGSRIASDPLTPEAGRRQPSEQHHARQQLEALAKPYRFRVRADAEGFPVISGGYGQIEWHCDGVNCSSCALPGRFAIAVYSDRPRLFSKLWAIPGVRRHQTGDREMRAVFQPEALEQVAAVIRAKRKRTQTSSQSFQNLRSRVTSRTQEPRLPHWTVRRRRELGPE